MSMKWKILNVKTKMSRKPDTCESKETSSQPKGASAIVDKETSSRAK